MNVYEQNSYESREDYIRDFADEIIIEVLVANNGRRNKIVEIFLHEAERRRRKLRIQTNAESQKQIDALSKAIKLYYNRRDSVGEMLLNSYI